MDARARAKRYEKLDFLGEGQVSGRWGAGRVRRSRWGPPCDRSGPLELPVAGPGPVSPRCGGYRARRRVGWVGRLSTGSGLAAGPWWPPEGRPWRRADRAGCGAGLGDRHVRGPPGRLRWYRPGRSSAAPVFTQASLFLLSLLLSIKRGIRTPTRSWLLKRWVSEFFSRSAIKCLVALDLPNDFFIIFFFTDLMGSRRIDILVSRVFCLNDIVNMSLIPSSPQEETLASVLLHFWRITWSVTWNFSYLLNRFIF